MSRRSNLVRLSVAGLPVLALAVAPSATASAAASLAPAPSAEAPVEDLAIESAPASSPTDDLEISVESADPSSSPPTADSAAAQQPSANPDGPAPGGAPAVPPSAPRIGAPAPAEPTESERLRATIEALESRIVQLEQRPQSSPAAAVAPRAPVASPQPTSPRPFWRWAAPVAGAPGAPSSAGFDAGVLPADYGVRFSGYMQVQYQWSQLSEDQLQQGGAPLNRNRFMVRRARLRANGDWKHFAFEFEIDGNTTRGLFFGIRQANLSVLWRNPDVEKPPYVQLIAGLTEVPFGYEVRLGQRDLLFMERSLGSLAFFPGPVDAGLRIRGGASAFRYDIAVMNGTPLDDRAGGPGSIDPTSKPDFAGRLGFEVTPRNVAVGGGVSFLAGTGFHPGADATKNTVQWQDFNENGSIDSGELVSVPGVAAVPSETFRHWAVNADFQLGVRSKLGWSTLLGEATIGSNLDRGLFVSDPISLGSDARQLQAYGAFTQELTKWAVVGFRYDLYDPNTDLLDRRRGSFVPTQSQIHTLSPLVGALLPAGLARGFTGRLVFQYDAVLDHLGRDERGVPANVRNDAFTVRLQGVF